MTKSHDPRRWHQPTRYDVNVFFVDLDASLHRDDLSFPGPTAVNTRLEVARRALKCFFVAMHNVNAMAMSSAPILSPSSTPLGSQPANNNASRSRLHFAMYGLFDDAMELVPVTPVGQGANISPTDAMTQFLPRYAKFETNHTEPVNYNGIIDALERIAAELPPEVKPLAVVRGIVLESRDKFHSRAGAANAQNKIAKRSSKDPFLALDIVRLGSLPDPNADIAIPESSPEQAAKAERRRDRAFALQIERLCERRGVAGCAVVCKTGFSVGTTLSRLVSPKHHFPIFKGDRSPLQAQASLTASVLGESSSKMPLPPPDLIVTPQRKTPLTEGDEENDDDGTPAGPDGDRLVSNSSFGSSLPSSAVRRFIKSPENLPLSPTTGGGEGGMSSRQASGLAVESPTAPPPMPLSHDSPQSSDAVDTPPPLPAAQDAATPLPSQRSDLLAGSPAGGVVEGRAPSEVAAAGDIVMGQLLSYPDAQNSPASSASNRAPPPIPAQAEPQVLTASAPPPDGADESLLEGAVDNSATAAAPIAPIFARAPTEELSVMDMLSRGPDTPPPNAAGTTSGSTAGSPQAAGGIDDLLRAPHIDPFAAAEDDAPPPLPPR